MDRAGLATDSEKWELTMLHLHLAESVARRREQLWRALVAERNGRGSRLAIALGAVADLGRGWINLRAIRDAHWLSRPALIVCRRQCSNAVLPDYRRPLVSSTKVPLDDRTGSAIVPAKEPADDHAGNAPRIEIAGSTDEERELTERVRCKIKSISSRTKRYLN